MFACVRKYPFDVTCDTMAIQTICTYTTSQQSSENQTNDAWRRNLSKVPRIKLTRGGLRTVMPPVLDIFQPVLGWEQFQTSRLGDVQWPQFEFIGKTCHTPSGVWIGAEGSSSPRNEWYCGQCGGSGGGGGGASSGFFFGDGLILVVFAAAATSSAFS